MHGSARVATPGPLLSTNASEKPGWPLFRAISGFRDLAGCGPVFCGQVLSGPVVLSAIGIICNFPSIEYYNENKLTVSIDVT